MCGAGEQRTLKCNYMTRGVLRRVMGRKNIKLKKKEAMPQCSGEDNPDPFISGEKDGGLFITVV